MIEQDETMFEDAEHDEVSETIAHVGEVVAEFVALYGVGVTMTVPVVIDGLVSSVTVSVT